MGEQIYAITLMRHAQSEGNALGYWQGQRDFPLSAQGLAQAHNRAASLLADGVVYDRIISSPLRRALQTAEIIAETLHVPLETDRDWMERDNGVLAGMPMEEARQYMPEDRLLHPYLPIGETGETQWELYLRAGRAIQNLLKQLPGRYLVVTHGGILNLAMYAILGISVQANFSGPRFGFQNTGYAMLTYTPANHRWMLYSLNNQQNSHLPDEG